MPVINKAAFLERLRQENKVATEAAERLLADPYRLAACAYHSGKSDAFELVIQLIEEETDNDVEEAAEALADYIDKAFAGHCPTITGENIVEGILSLLDARDCKAVSILENATEQEKDHDA